VYFFRLLGIVLLASLSTVLTAQNSTFKNEISLGFGANAFSLISKDLGSSATTAALQYKYGVFHKTPTFQIAYDRSITRWFSAGAALTYNRARYEYDGLEYNGRKLGIATLTVGRTTIGTRLCLHFFNNRNWDFYSGGRLGLGFWTGRLSLEADEDLKQELSGVVDENLRSVVPRFIRKRLIDNIGIRSGFIAPQFQVIPIGVRAHLNNKIGIGAELALGSPYFICAGFQYRFP
jgi:hypothetical protein